MQVLSKKKLNKSFSKQLIKWGYANGRNKLPWQVRTENRLDPYKVWISEIMLQQTRVIAVLPKFNEFIKRFPKVLDLADANYDEVLESWVGLGYYRRAKFLHTAAKIIVRKGRVKFPSSAKEWEALPGVGPSTAAAISSFVNLERVAIMDSNVYRVIARFYCLTDLGSEGKNRKKASELALQLLPKDPEYMPFYSQYIMDLGSLICTNKNPSCDLCPVSNGCDAKASNLIDKFPVRIQKKWKEKILDWNLLITENKILLERQLKDSLWHSLFVPATKESLISPQTSSEKLFIKRYRVNVSNCKLTINVWKEDLSSNNILLKKNQILVDVTNVRNAPLPKVLVKILQDLSLS